MKKIVLIVLVMALLAGSAASKFDIPAGSSGHDGCVDKCNEGKCCGNNFGPHKLCTEICPGKSRGDKCGCNHFGQLDECVVFEKCDECGKTFCDGICDECGEECLVYEYCPVCGIKYPCEHADGFCDRCGGDCYCMEKCQNCGHNHYFNGWCDECASRCYYGRCCHMPHEDNCHEQQCQPCSSCSGDADFADGEEVIIAIVTEGNSENVGAAPAMGEGFPMIEVVDSEAPGASADQAPTVNPLDLGAPA